MGYIKQDNIVPITAKEYLIKNWKAYKVDAALVMTMASVVLPVNLFSTT